MTAQVTYSWVLGEQAAVMQEAAEILMKKLTDGSYREGLRREHVGGEGEGTGEEKKAREQWLDKREWAMFKLVQQLHGLELVQRGGKGDEVPFSSRITMTYKGDAWMGKAEQKPVDVGKTKKKDAAQPTKTRHCADCGDAADPCYAVSRAGHVVRLCRPCAHRYEKKARGKK